MEKCLTSELYLEIGIFFQTNYARGYFFWAKL